MKMKKRLIVFFTVLLIIVILVFLLIDHRLRDRSKPNIFEIPGTAHEWTSDYKTRIKDISFFIQDVPDKKGEIEKTITKYVEENGLLKKHLKAEVGELDLVFYTPSLSLPVSFEENKSFWIMDDYISHYEDERVVLVIYNNSKTPEFVFYNKYRD